jgi:hypothetical protein
MCSCDWHVIIHQMTLSQGGIKVQQTVKVAGRVNLSSSSISSSSAFGSRASSTETYIGRCKWRAAIFAGSRDSVAEKRSF